MAEDIETLTKRVYEAIESNKSAEECAELSEQIVLALVSEPRSDELKTLNYRWQTYLGKEYVRSHHIDEFLDKLIRHVLAKKPENPLEEMLNSLTSVKGNPPSQRPPDQ